MRGVWFYSCGLWCGPWKISKMWLCRRQEKHLDGEGVWVKAAPSHLQKQSLREEDDCPCCCCRRPPTNNSPSSFTKMRIIFQSSLSSYFPPSLAFWLDISDEETRKQINLPFFFLNTYHHIIDWIFKSALNKKVQRVPSKCQNRCFPWKHLILQPLRLSHALLGFIHLEPSIACSWASSKLDDIGLLLRTEKLLGATSLCGPSGFRKAYFACPGRTPKRNLPVTCQGVAGPDVCFWQCWADTSICQVCLFMTPSRQLEKRWKGLLDLRKKVVRKEREEGEALAKLRFPSDISEHVVFLLAK